MPQEPILVSAIVSAFNSERFIRGCIADLERQSIADQTEIIVVDSGSQQNERAIIAELQERLSNLRYIRTDTRETVYAAWNRGIQAARGVFITNANTDDRHRADAFERMVAALDEHPEAALVYADVLQTETENETFERCHPIGCYRWHDWDRNLLLTKGCFMGPQPMWRRSVHELYGYFDERLVTSGDYEFWLRISQTLDFYHVRQPLGLYLVNPASIEHRNRERQHAENSEILNLYRKAAMNGQIVRCLPIERLIGFLRNESCKASGWVRSAIGQVEVMAGFKPGLAKYRPAGCSPDEERLLELKKLILQKDGQPDAIEEIIRLGSRLSLNRTAWYPRFQRQRDSQAGSIPDTVKMADSHHTGDIDMLTVEHVYEAMQPVLQNSRPGDAIRALQNIVRLFPDFARAHNDLGTLYYQMREKQKALGHFERAAGISPLNADFQKNLADYYCVEMDRIDDALKLYRRVIEIRVNDIETHMTVGHILVRLQRFEEADAHYRRVLEIEPWNPEANECHKALGRRGSDRNDGRATENMDAELKRRLDSGDSAGAIQYLEKMLGAYPKTAVAHNDLAVLCYQSGAKLKALRHYEEAVRLQPNNATFQKNLADFYYVEQGRIQDALKIYVQILELEPLDVETLFAVGKICGQLGQPEDAKAFFTRILDIEPWNREAADCLNLCRAVPSLPPAEQVTLEMHAEAMRLASNGDNEAALAALERLAKVYPDFALAYNDLGVLSYQAGKKKAALQYYQSAVRLDPQNMTFQKNLADCYWVEFDRLEDALKIYNSILAVHPEDVETLVAIGKICRSMQQPDDARIMFDRALQIEPLNPEASQQLKELEALNRAA
jgi:tetratricopeptide (TPR) repeat protein